MAHDPWHSVLDTLSNPYRRQLLVALLAHNPQDEDDVDPLDLFDDGDDGAAVLQSELIHQHLPKLEELGYIDWDRDSGKISKGPAWDEVAPLLQLIEEHRDELPDGWL